MGGAALATTLAAGRQNTQSRNAKFRVSSNFDKFMVILCAMFAVHAVAGMPVPERKTRPSSAPLPSAKIAAGTYASRFYPAFPLNYPGP